MDWILAVPNYIGRPDAHLTRNETILGYAGWIVIFLLISWYFWWAIDVAFKKKRVGTRVYDEEFRRNRVIALRHSGNRCEQCGFGGTVDVHHRVPRARGGGNEIANLEVLCPNCHAMIHRKGRR